jgi:streptogramin lyase
MPVSISPGAEVAPRRRLNPVAARRRYVRETTFLLGAIAIAIIGQGYLTSPAPGALALGAGLLAVAALLTLRVSGSLDSDAQLRGRPADRAPAAGAAWVWPTRLAAPPVARMAVAAVGCALVGLIIFARSDGVLRNLAWLAYLASMVLGVLTAWRLDAPKQTSVRRWSRRDTAILAGILAVAAFYRLWHLWDEPWGLWFDEAAHGLDVLHLLRDPAFRPVYLQTLVPEPALHWYFDAIFFLLFGPTVFALRISAVLAGIVGVTAIFFLGRELYGWRTGVVAGGFLAAASWHVDFSRVMFNAIWSVALDALAAYFLVRALRGGRYRDYGVAGLCLGLGLNNYYTSRLFVGVVLLYLAYRLVLGGGPFLRRSLGGLLVFSALLLLSAGPLLEFAVQHPDQFNARVDQVSVFGEISAQHSYQPLISNVEKHLEMFNLAGDPNGRHNLSGSPELDQVLAALFVLGLALALRRAFRPEFGLPLIWLPVILAGGIFSLDFEAPQSLRTIDNSLVSVLFAAIPLGALWARLAWLRLGQLRWPGWLGGPAVFSAGAVLALALVGWSATLSYHKYFGLQANDFRSWAEYSASQTEIGLEIRQLNLQTTDVYLGEPFLGQPTINFLAPNYHNEVMFDPAKDLPFRAIKNVAVFLPDNDDRVAAEIQQIYPNAEVRAFGPPFGGPTVLYSVYVSAQDVAALQGLAVDYYLGVTPTGTPIRSAKNATVDFDWAKTPLPLSFTADWHGILSAPSYGLYEFQLQGPAASTLYLDEKVVRQGPGLATLTLAEGTHTLRVIAPETQPTPVHLRWRPPGAPLLGPIPRANLFGPPAASHGLLGQYYPNPDWSGGPALERIDPAMEIDFHILPIPRPFSVVWSGKIDIPTDGTYVFGTQSIDSSWVTIDGKLVATNQGQPNGYAEGAIHLTNGMHDLQIKFQSLTNFNYITLSWQPPGYPREVVPADRLYPPQGAYPTRTGPLRPETLRVTSSTGAVSPAANLGAPPAPPTPAPGASAAVGVLPVAPRPLLRVIGTPGTSPGQMLSPRGVAIDADGNVDVVDAGNHRIDQFDSSGKFLRSWGGPNPGPDQLVEPVDAVVDAQGQVVVLDSANGWLKVFTAAGKFVAQFGGPALAMYHPRGLAIGPNGNFYIADTGDANVVELAATGALLQKLGSRGAGPGQVAEPVGVAVAADGSLYLTDTVNDRLTHFDPSFQLLQAWPLPKSTSVLGPHPWVAADNTIFVTAPDEQRVIHYDSSGQPMDQLGASGQLSQPVGIRGDAKGDLFVVDAAANHVVEFGPPAGH